MSGPDLPRLAVLAGPEHSLSPADIARSADGLADCWFLLDGGDSSASAQALHSVASALAPTTVVDFADLDACRDAVRESGADAVVTFTDKFCAMADLLNAEIHGTGQALAPWGRKDVQRRMLHEAGVSKVKAAKIEGEESLRSFIQSAGLPVVVKPTGGAASRDTWLLATESDIHEFLSTGGAEGHGAGMFAEQFIVGQPAAATHLADYVSVEVFRSRACLPGSSHAPSQAFVTDRLIPAWPCRETGEVLPSAWDLGQQQAVIAAAEQALDALGATAGAFHVEIKTTRPSPEVIEVNGRLGGFLDRMVRYGTGRDLGRVALSCALGRQESLDLRWDRCVLALFFQAPARAERIVKAPARRELTRRAGVLAVDQITPPGTTVDWRDGTNLAITFAWLAADSHAELRARLLDVVEFLSDEFSFADKAGRTIQDRTWFERLMLGAGSEG